VSWGTGAATVVPYRIKKPAVELSASDFAIFLVLARRHQLDGFH